MSNRYISHGRYVDPPDRPKQPHRRKYGTDAFFAEEIARDEVDDDLNALTNAMFDLSAWSYRLIDDHDDGHRNLVRNSANEVANCLDVIEYATKALREHLCLDKLVRRDK